jgi:hypothetical protein
MPSRRYLRAHRMYEPEQERTKPVTDAHTEANPAAKQPEIVQMQKLMGNQAVQRFLIQMQEDPGNVGIQMPEMEIEGKYNPPTEIDAKSENAIEMPEMVINVNQKQYPGPLTGSQEQKAINYYRQKLNDGTYNTETMVKIQNAVGASEGAYPNAELAQKVAIWQQAHPPLWVDGMAGPRTLPAMFEQGVDTEDPQRQFVAKSANLEQQWKTLDVNGRMAILNDAANQTMEKLKLPPHKKAFATAVTSGDYVAYSAYNTWELGIDKSMLEIHIDDSPESQAILPEVVTMLQESVMYATRTSEQMFSIARMLAGYEADATLITQEIGIPLDIAQLAVGMKYDPKSMEAVVADGWYQALFGLERAKYEKVRQEFYEAEAEMQDASGKLANNDNPQNRARNDIAIKRYEKAKKEYDTLPEINDRKRVADDVRKMRAEMERMNKNA